MLKHKTQTMKWTQALLTKNVYKYNKQYQDQEK